VARHEALNAVRLTLEANLRLMTTKSLKHCLLQRLFSAHDSFAHSGPKRPVEVRIAELEDKLQRLKLEKQIADLQAQLERQKPAGRRTPTQQRTPTKQRTPTRKRTGRSRTS